MTEPTPAIVTQDAVRPLPRWILLLLCAAYAVPGFVARDPWKNADVAAFGAMLELYATPSRAAWLNPEIMGLPVDPSALLPYWLGAWALQLAPPWLAPEVAVRVPFLLMLGGTLAATWSAVRNLASYASAQPVVFAFGGEAQGSDYARALADGALLALLATLGLAQLAHETTPALAQLFFATLVFYGFSALPFLRLRAPLLLAIGLLGLTLCGAPVTALIYGAITAVAALRIGLHGPASLARLAPAVLVVAAVAACAWLFARGIAPPHWRLSAWRSTWADWQSLGRLLLWFTWPAWIFVLWTLWRWRRQVFHPRQQRQLAVPLFIAGVPLAHAALTLAGDRALLLALPALAALSAFALPTFKRTATALIDSFTVLFFTAAAIAIWLVWISLESGVPASPAELIARLAPDFEPILQWPALVAAALATLAWIALVQWRTARHRPALWKSLVLPAAGTTLCWLLLMTLWLPALNYARSFGPQFEAMHAIIPADARCVQVHGLSQAQLAAVIFHGGWQPRPLRGAQACPWLLVSAEATDGQPAGEAARHWHRIQKVPRPSHKSEALYVYRRAPAD